MFTVRDKREIVDDVALHGAMRKAALPQSYSQNEQPDAALATLLREKHDAGWECIKQRFLIRRNGTANVRERSYLTDTLIQALYDYAKEAEPVLEDVSIIAVGGYGRYELSPYSDIDLLFLYEAKHKNHAERLARWMLSILWDMRLQVGHALRTVAETVQYAKDDHTIHTTLLDERRVAGNIALHNEMQQAFWQKAVQGREPEFLRMKLDERTARHERHGELRYMVEPHLKEGKGGQRDLQSLWWIAKNSYGLDKTRELVTQNILSEREYRIYTLARGFFWQTRAYMHYFSSRAEERLTFDLQREISQAMEYENRPGMLGVERFMKRYFTMAKHVGDLTRVICAVLEEERITQSAFQFPEILQRKRKLAGFPLKGQRLRFADNANLEKDPLALLQIFDVAQRHGLDIHPEALKRIRRNLTLITRTMRRDDKANRLFLAILTSEHNPALTLRRMSEAGVLGRFIPDFGRVIGLMQFDMYHMLTVDEHTIHAIDILHGIEQGQYEEPLPLASGLIHQVALRRALYVAVFLHDIAKGRGGDHSDLGAKLALKLCPRLGMSPQETEMVSWLVQYHLLMSHTAFKRDLGDVETVRRFVAEVQSLERLKLLLILTVADIRAVSPQAWSGWKAVLLRELYNLAAERMGGGGDKEDRNARVDAIRQSLVPHLQDWPTEVREDYLQMPLNSFWLGLPPEEHPIIAELVRETQLADYPLNTRFTPQPDREVTELMLCTTGQHALFAQVTGACAASRVSIISAKVFSLPLGLTVILLDLQTPEGLPLDDTDKQSRLIERIRATVGKTTRQTKQEARKQEQFTPRSSKAFRVAPYVLVDNTASHDYTVIEVMARDRLGLLYTIADTLARHNLLVATSHISTYGEKAIDVFYVRDLFGLKLTDERKVKRLRKQLLQALQEEETI